MSDPNTVIDNYLRTPDTGADAAIDRYLGRTPAAEAPTEQPGGYNLVGLYRFLRNNPEVAAHMAIQGVVGGAGTAVGGLVGNAPGAIVGGGAGNLVGDMIGRWATGQEQPTLDQGAVSAGLGAVGGLASHPLTALRGATRAFTGATPAVRSASQAAGSDAASTAMREFTEFITANPTAPGGAPWTAAGLARAAEEIASRGAQAQSASLQAGAHGMTGGITAAGALGAGALYQTVVRGDLVSAAGLLAGAGAAIGRRHAAEALLRRPGVQAFILRENVPSAEHFASIVSGAGVAGLQRLGLDEATSRELHSYMTGPSSAQAASATGPEPAPVRRGAFEEAFPDLLTVMTPGGLRGRDPRSGRFASLNDE